MTFVLEATKVCHAIFDKPLTVQMYASSDIVQLLINQWGDVTLLFQEENGQPGLQIYLPTEDAKKQKGIQLIQEDVDLESGTWISAPIIPNTVLVSF
jgi:hypothetical protein